MIGQQRNGWNLNRSVKTICNMMKATKITTLQKNLCKHFGIPFRLIDDVISAEREGLETVLVSRWQRGTSDEYCLKIKRTTFCEGSECVRTVTKNLNPEMTAEDWIALEKLCRDNL
jgi:hypothetical protein